MVRKVESKSPIDQIGELVDHVARGEWKLLSFETTIDHATRTATIEVKLNMLARESEPEAEKTDPPGLTAGIPIRDLDFE